MLQDLSVCRFSSLLLVSKHRRQMSLNHSHELRPPPTVRIFFEFRVMDQLALFTHQ